MVGYQGMKHRSSDLATTMSRRESPHLNDLLPWVDTPCHSVRAFAMSIGPQVTLTVNRVVGDAGISLNATDEIVQQGRSHKELEIGLKILKVVSPLIVSEGERSV